MPTIITRKNPSGKIVYRVQYRLSGERSISRTFATMKLAKEFVTVTDAKVLQDKHNAMLGIRRTTFTEVLDRYKSEVQRFKRHETIRSQVSVLNYWQQRLGDKRIAGITSSDIHNCIDELMEKRSIGTVHKYNVVLHHIFNKAVLWDYITKNPMLGMTRLATGRPRDRHLNQGEIDRLLKVCERDSNPHIYAMVMFALNTGCRLGEMLKVETGDIKNGYVMFHERKNGQVHRVPISPALQRVLDDYNETVWPMNFEKISDGRISKLFFQDKQGKAVSIQQTWKRVLKDALLDDEKVVWHTLRHTTASLLLEQGYSLAVVAKILGHRSVSSSARYAHLEDQQMNVVMDKFSEVVFGVSKEE